MADNCIRTAGSGEVIHTDEYTHATLGSGKTLLAKLVDGTLGNSAEIAAGAGDETNGLRAVPSLGAAATVTAISSVANSSQLVLAANPARRGLMLWNTDSNQVYVKFGAVASATSFSVRIGPSAYWEMPVVYTGVIEARWSANGVGQLLITELT